jgi:hypothetical protein
VDQDCRLVNLAAGELDELLAFLEGVSPACVAINAPQRPNRGLVRKRMEKLRQTSSPLRGADLRLAEYELRERGISISPTPSRPELCAAWQQMGFEVYRRLAGMGFKPYPPGKASRCYLETHPHAAFCALIGQLPLPNPTLEGRLQRQLILSEQGMSIKDPMDFFEEITSHKLLHGHLPMEFVYAPEELDALAAAYVAWMAADSPGLMTLIGDEQEGRIVLPVREMQDLYK